MHEVGTCPAYGFCFVATLQRSEVQNMPLAGRMGNLSVKPSDAKAAKKPPKASQAKKAVAAVSATVRAPSISSTLDIGPDSALHR